MTEVVQAFRSAEELTAAAARLRERALRQELSPGRAIDSLERCGAALHGHGIESLPGVPFLRLWLRRGTLEPIVVRELGREALDLGWRADGGTRLRVVPLGVVGHWPAGNIEIQPLLSLSCSLLAGNAAIVRVPSGLIKVTRALVEKLWEADPEGVLRERVIFAAFEHTRRDLQEAMAGAVDGAMIWGGREAILQVRALPFAHWARVLTFGPRLSVAAMDAATWGDELNRQTWCRRMARDLWQFDQQACSSPQTLFLERRRDCDVAEFLHALARAITEENRAHPRVTIEPALTSAICLARARWLLGGAERTAVFPTGPDWTLLAGAGPDIPEPVQGRTLSVLTVDSLFEPIARFDGNVQTLGLGVESAELEDALARAAAVKGVDRVVKLGQMHVFGSPWDGMDLVRPLARVTRHVPIHER